MSRTYAVETYGCQMNVHDSERIAGLLDEAGFIPVEPGSQADIVVFNTCACCLSFVEIPQPSQWTDDRAMNSWKSLPTCAGNEDSPCDT